MLEISRKIGDFEIVKEIKKKQIYAINKNINGRVKF